MPKKVLWTDSGSFYFKVALHGDIDKRTFVAKPYIEGHCFEVFMIGDGKNHSKWHKDEMQKNFDEGIWVVVDAE